MIYTSLDLHESPAKSVLLLYSHLHVHASQRHNIKDRRMKENAWRKTQEDFFSNIFTSHFICKVCVWEDAGDRT